MSTTEQIPSFDSERGRAFASSQSPASQWEGACRWLRGHDILRLAEPTGRSVFDRCEARGESPTSIAQSSITPQRQGAIFAAMELRADPRWQELDERMRPIFAKWLAGEQRKSAEIRRLTEQAREERRKLEEARARAMAAIERDGPVASFARNLSAIRDRIQGMVSP